MNLTTVEFQVSEYYDPTKNKIWKVQLEYREVVRDPTNFSYLYMGQWKTVPRMQIVTPEI